VSSQLLAQSPAGGPPVPAPPVDPRGRVRDASAALRFAASTAFLVVVMAWSQARQVHFAVLIYPMLVYVALALVATIFRKRAVIRRLAWVMSLLDLVILFILLGQGILVDPQHLPSWAVTSLGVYTMAVVLTGLSMPVRFVALHTAMAACALSLLLHAAGLSLWQPIVATITLAFAAVATSTVPRLAERVRRQEAQTADALASLSQAHAQNAKLERLERERDALLETIVHDMRSPVSAAVLSLEYLALELRKRPADGEMLEATQDALGVLSSLSRMIGQILDVAKLESGRLTLHPDLIELRPILEAALAGVASRAQSRSIVLALDAPEGLQAAVDVRLLPSVLDVLLTYLVRHATEGHRVLVVASRDPAGVRISFHGQAPTVPPAHWDGLFDKLPLLDRDGRRISTWTSGFYFCRLVVAAHQGTIAVQPVDGWAMSLVMHLPG
jgi:two-component system heavy metal sensor histidine kinase CusS